MNFKIFWKSWNWQSYSSECLRYWLHWHLVVETSSLTVKQLKCESQLYLVGMWRHSEIRRWGYVTKLTDYENLPGSGWSIRNTVITGLSSPHRMNGWSLGMSGKFWDHYGAGPCGCLNGILLLCIMLSLSTMTHSIIWMEVFKLLLRRRPNGRKTYILPWSLHAKSWPDIMLELLRRRVCFWFPHRYSILSRSCDRLDSGTRVRIMLWWENSYTTLY